MIAVNFHIIESTLPPEKSYLVFVPQTFYFAVNAFWVGHVTSEEIRESRRDVHNFG